jgi:hypothetical protein
MAAKLLLVLKAAATSLGAIAVSIEVTYPWGITVGLSWS